MFTLFHSAGLWLSMRVRNSWTLFMEIVSLCIYFDVYSLYLLLLSASIEFSTQAIIFNDADVAKILSYSEHWNRQNSLHDCRRLNWFCDKNNKSFLCTEEIAHLKMWQHFDKVTKKNEEGIYIHFCWITSNTRWTHDKW